MELDPYRKVVISNPIIVNFLSTNNADYILEAVERNLEHFCLLYKKTLDNHRSETNTNILLEHMKDLEKRQHEQQLQMMRVLDNKFDTNFEKASHQIGGLLINVTRTINQAISELNIENISSSLSKSVEIIISKNADQSHIKLQQVAQTIKDTLIDKVIEPVSRSSRDIIETINNIPFKLESDTKDQLNDIKDKFQSHITHLSTHLQGLEKRLIICDGKYETNNKILETQLTNIPKLTKGIICGALKDLDFQTREVFNTINNTISRIPTLESDIRNNKELLNVVVANNSRFDSKLDAMQQHISRTKTASNQGKEGETGLFDLLCSKLYGCDGYSVEKVSHTSYGCDLLIKREAFSHIRIESKAHRDKVQYKEVLKFERDLRAMNNHGIFVSLYSDIMNVPAMDIRQLENGRLAVYISNNNFDIDVITSMISFIYKVDAIVSNNKMENHILISKENMEHIRKFVCDYKTKIDKIKAQLKDSLSDLNDMDMTLIERLIVSDIIQQKQELVCPYCDTKFVRASNRTKHMQTCKKKNK